MKQHTALLFLSLAAIPLLAQPTIGGGSCSSATIAGTYAATINGRGITKATSGGDISSVIEAVGTVNFDGQSKAVFTLTANTATASGSSLPWAGTYTVQANCTGAITVTTAGNATLNLAVYNGGVAFALTGNDSTYVYTGSGSTIATGCSTSTLTGVYAVTATGYFGVSSGSAGGAASLTGIVQFDGAGNVTATWAGSANGFLAGVTGSGNYTLTGTYSLGTSCTGNASLSSPILGAGNLTLSAYSGNSTQTNDFYVAAASTKPDLMLIGNLQWIGPVSAQTAAVNAAASTVNGAKL